MNIAVIYQPEAQEVRDISAHVIDHLEHRYGAHKVSTTTRPIAGQTPARSLALARVVVVLIGPQWTSHAQESAAQALRQAMAQRKMIVPVLLGGAVLPAPVTPELSALATRQAMVVRPDPYLTEDLNRVFGEVNTQLEWAPMSVVLMALALLCLLLVSLFLWLTISGRSSEAADSLFLYLPMQALLFGVALWLAWTRRAWWWGALVAVSAVISLLLLFPLPYWVNIPALYLYPTVLLLFGLLGPRRELERMRPSRVRVSTLGRRKIAQEN